MTHSKKRILWLFASMVVLVGLSCISAYSLLNEKVEDVNSNAKPIDHSDWNYIVANYVSSDGLFDYDGLYKDKGVLERYLQLLSKHHPNDQYWSREEQLAYWINAYNAFTVKIVSDHYPIESIKEIKKGIPFVNSVWDIKYIQIENEMYDLNNIEHGILRKKFDEPRIHFAINCASKSCPKLYKEAFEADRIEDQLSYVTLDFLQDSTKNQYNDTEIKISKIFKWFKSDFTKTTGIVEFINDNSGLSINKEVKINYLDYDWNINDSSPDR